MKTRTITFIALAIVATLIIGAFTFNAMSAPKELKLKVKWRPNYYTLDSGPPDPWVAQVFFAPIRSFSDINAASIRLEGIYTLESSPYLVMDGVRLALPFHGYDVLQAALSKIPHMMPGIYYVSLTITGNLNDGTPFSGSGLIEITVPEPPPP